MLGINYLTADASTLEKVHPATYMIIITFSIWIIQSIGDKNRAIDLKKVKFCVYYLICTMVVLLYAVSFLEGQLALIADSFMCPPLFMMMMHFLTPKQRQVLLAMVLAFVALNVVIIFYEFGTGSLFLPPVYNDFVDLKVVHTASATEYEGRASGLYGHPLSAGTLTLIFLVAAIETSRRHRWQMATMTLTAGAIATFPTFGSRWSILLFGCYCAFVTARFLYNVSKSRRISQQAIVIFFVICFGALPAGIVAGQLGVFDTLVDRFQNDNGSAESRMAAWEIFVSSEPAEIFLGDVDGNVSNKLIVGDTAYGIEVFWLGFVMRYGVLCAALYFPSLLGLMYQLYKDGGTMGAMVAIAFLAAISGSLSILGKTELFSQVVIFAYAMIPIGYGPKGVTRQTGQSAVVTRLLRTGPRWSDEPAPTR